MDKNSNRIGIAYILSAGALWGTIGIFVKNLEAQGANVETISLIRVVFACLIMFILCMIKGGMKSLYVNRTTLLICALLGVICHGIYNIFYSIAVVKAGVAVSAILLDVAPVFTFGFSVVLFQEKITVQKMIGVLINVAGCILAVTGGNFGGAALEIVGILFGAGAGICYSLTAIIGRYAGERTDSFTMSFYSYLFSTVFLAVYMLFGHHTFIVNRPVMITGFFYALIPTAIAYVIYYIGVQKMSDSSKVPVVASVEVIIACILGVICYQEKLGAWNVLGILLVIGSIFVMNYTGGKKHGSKRLT